MRSGKLNAVFLAIQELSWSQQQELVHRLQHAQAARHAAVIVEERLQALRMCPHCNSLHVVRNGMAPGLQRYKCRACCKTFNALTGTALARLRYRERWLEQTQALIDSISITQAAQRLDVARSTAFRWRHRFLALPHQIMARQLTGIVEADETCLLKSFKEQPSARQHHGRKARRRGGRASVRGMSDQHDIVLVARDRSGACADHVVAAIDAAHLAAVLQPLLAPDVILCTDGSAALAAAARHIGVEHHAVNAIAGVRAVGAWHINNVNGHHSRFKGWLHRFKGVASSYLAHYLGWFRTLDRFGPAGVKPSWLLAVAASDPIPSTRIAPKIRAVYSEGFLSKKTNLNR